MKTLKIILQFVRREIEHGRSLSRALATAVKRKPRQPVPNALEIERLDRLRNQRRRPGFL